MYVLTTINHDDDIKFWGPFPTAERAEKYALHMVNLKSVKVFTLIRPHSVVRRIEWKGTK